MSKVFSSAAASGKRELVIKKESSTPETAAIESGDWSTLFSVTTLNHLQLSGFPSITSLPPDIGRLVNLLQLTITHDSLTALPEEVSGLTKLKHLDVSFNRLCTLPASLYTLQSLQTLIVSNNDLTDDSFPPITADGVGTNIFPSLHRVDLLGNRLTVLPEVIYTTLPLLDIVASDNNISVLEPRIGCITGLKTIDLKRNQLKTLPYELSLCLKLRNMGFEENPISDRRLLKLVAQHGASKPKAVLDYVAAHSPRVSAPSDASKSKKGQARGTERRLSAAELGDDGSDDDVTFSRGSGKFIQVVRPPEHVVVQVSSTARKVRPYLVCAVVRGVDLSSDVAYREFINLQTRLHDTVCKRRRSAALATHNLDRMCVPLHYECHAAADVSMTPLNWSKKVTVLEFLRHLHRLKGDKRGGGGGGGKKGKGGGAKKEGHAGAEAAKEQDAAGVALSKYLQFVDESAVVYLRDNRDVVVSLPPITNSEESKIGEDTVNLFLEVSSSESLAVCKTVMDALVCGMCERNVGVVDNVLRVEQVKVVEDSDKLLVLYPSRTDLIDTEYEVLRPQS